MSAQLLVVRGEDLVVLGVEYDGCDLQPSVLVAGAEGGTLTVIFPPQSVAEAKSASFLARQSAPSRVCCRLAPGDSVVLDVPGLLGALVTHEIDTDATVIELPYGLELQPRGVTGSLVGTGTTAALAAPGSDAGTRQTGLWQFVLADGTFTSGRVVVDRLRAPARDDPPDSHPLDSGERGTLAATALPVTVDRLRLSALGGTLTASVAADFLGWDHRTALGRDQRVRFAQAGVLFPFGHRATFVETVERVVQPSGEASLRRESSLRIPQRVINYPDDHTPESRCFPFDEAEVLVPVVDDLSLNGVEFWERPPDLTDALELAAQTAETERDQFIVDFQGRFPLPVPRTITDLEVNTAWSIGEVGDVALIRLTIAEHGQAIQDLIDSAPHVGPPDPPDTDPPVTLGPDGLSDDFGPEESLAMPVSDDIFISAQLQAMIDQHEAAIRDLEDQLRDKLAAIDRYLAELAAWVPAGPTEANDAVAWARQLVAGGIDNGAATIVQKADLAGMLRARLAEAKPPTVSRLVRADGSEYVLPVRLAGRHGDITISAPLLFLHDLRVPADDFFAGYQSLRDPAIIAGRVLADVAVAAEVVDLVRRPGDAAPTDLQEIHAITIAGRHLDPGVRPVLAGFQLALPDLRTLLPDNEFLSTGRLSDQLVTLGDTSVPVVLDPVPVDFEGRAERGGGLMTPSFSADRISEQFGPVAGATLPGSGLDPMAALSGMKLFGFSLSSLLRGFDGPPSIKQVVNAGVPRGVRLEWRQRPLRSFGPFVARSAGGTVDTTMLDLRVEQTVDSAMTDCTVSAFSLALPSPQFQALVCHFDSIAFRVRDGREPTLDVSGFKFEFGEALSLLKDLQEQADLGDLVPLIRSRPDGIEASWALRLPSATCGVFQLSNVAFGVEVMVPFRAGVPTVTFSFATPEAPFLLSVVPFGGSGYLELTVDGSGLQRVSGSLEFGGSAGVDFVVASAEVHVMAGVRVELAGGEVLIAGFLHIGGSVKILGLVTVSVELRVELAYDSGSNELWGQATLVVEIDLTLYADSVELDSGVWVFAGGSDAAPAELGSPPPEQEWHDYQGSYA